MTEMTEMNKEQYYASFGTHLDALDKATREFREAMKTGMSQEIADTQTKFKQVLDELLDLEQVAKQQGFTVPYR
jgi:predicted metal-binding protein